jgi:hypothetical protein
MLALQSADAKDVATVDEVLATYAKTLVRTDNLNEEVKTFLAGKPELAQPGYVKLDLDGDGNIDIVLLTRDLKRDEVLIRVFICSGACRQEKVEVVGANGDVFLQQIASGTVIQESESTSGKAQAHRLGRGAVKVLNFGKAEIVYYWDPIRKVIKSVTTGD